MKKVLSVELKRLSKSGVRPLALVLGFDTATSSFSLNVGIAVLAAVICVVCACMQYRESNSRTSKLSEILSQPVQKINSEEVDL